MKPAPGLPLFLSIGLTACVSLSGQQAISTDLNQWTRYAFYEGSDNVNVEVPSHSRIFNSSLPESAYRRGQRLLLDAQYDFPPQSPDTSEFEVKMSLVQLKAPLSSESVTPEELDGALNSAFGHPIQSGEGMQPIGESIHGRAWIHYDNTTDVTYGQTRETYGTLVNATTTLLITAWYGPSLRKRSSWFDSRRRILRQICDNTTITSQSR